MAKKTVSGMKEWSSSSVNCMDGCPHDCRYCYAKADAIRFGRTTPDTWKDEKPRESTSGKRYGKRQGTVMFPTSHDITDGNIRYCLETLGGLLRVGNKVLVVSKPRLQIVKALCDTLANMADWAHMDWKKQVLFRFTIGSMDPETLGFWEPGAPTFAERLCALMWVFENGWQTSVSMEPMLDDNLDDVIRLVRTVAPYVTDAVWIGKANNLRQRCSMNAGGNLDSRTDMMVLQLEAAWTDARIKDLYYRNINCDPELRPKVKWKESIKKVIGLEIPAEAGLDI